MTETATAGDNCILCRREESKGHWQLCDECRNNLIERSRARQAAMAPDHCMVCFVPRCSAPVAGALYCPRCQQRYSG